MTLTEFLLARIAEDEAAAKAATPGPWFWESESTESWPMGDRSLVAIDEAGKWERDSYFGGCSEFLRQSHPTRGDVDGEHEHQTTTTVLSGWGYDASGINGEDTDRDHIARFDPVRVLAECEAKRRIVEYHTEERFRFDVPGSHLVTIGPEGAMTLRLLALPYADHPDYLEEWRRP